MPAHSSRAAAPSVLHAIAPGPVGGAETVVLGLLAGLRDAGVPVGVAVLADASSEPFLQAARGLGGVRVEWLDAAGRAYWRDWHGGCHGYEGFLVDSFLPLLAVFDEWEARR